MTQVFVITDEQLRQLIAPLEAKIDALTQKVGADWLSIHDYATHMGASERTVRRWIEAGKVETRRVGRKVVVRT